jgi:hypothetical protein
LAYEFPKFLKVYPVSIEKFGGVRRDVGGTVDLLCKRSIRISWTMPRFIDLITECLKDAEREVLQKRRVVDVMVHGGGFKKRDEKKGKFMLSRYSFRFNTKNRGRFIYSVKMGYFRSFYMIATF